MRQFELFEAATAGDDTTLRFSGELDAAGAPQAHTALSSAVGRGAGDVEVDVSRLEFIDSVGLGALVKAAGQLQRQDRRLVVTGAEGAVRRAIDLTGFGELLGVAG
jgi:anti-anti-sigma factor